LILEFFKKIEEKNQGFYKVIDDDLENIKSFAKKKEGKYSDVVVLGIGGSALGLICLQQSLKHLFQNELESNTHPKLHVLDNIDPVLIKETEDVIDYEKTLFITISKSGGTPETISQYLYFRKKCDEKGLDPKDHFVLITGKNGFLREIADSEEIPSFKVPENVGGRFSVLTNVGLVPAALIGIDIDTLILGAKQMRDKFINESFDMNLPFQLATFQYLLGEKGKIMNVLMPYSQNLIKFADWFRQLLAESIGKNKDVGLTPVSALGVTDQHSQSQLYHDGPNDKFFIFMELDRFNVPDIVIPEKEGLDYLKDVTFNKLINTEKRGTEMSLTQTNRPNITIKLDQLNTKNLGGLFMLFEGATAFLGEYYGINAFDQPGVELSKKLTKELLTQ